jgi:hypothetical protein
VVESLCLRYFDIAFPGIRVESPAIGANAEVSARVAMLVQLDLTGAAHVHKVHAFIGRKDTLKGCPVRLSDRD